MKVAIASGKGGTGKTTLAVNLALVATGSEVMLLDCDVEEPNVHIFLSGENPSVKDVNILMPEIIEERCIAGKGCTECADFCEFNAVVCMGDTPVISPELCHGCGGCRRACPKKAIREVPRRTGTVQVSQRDNIRLVQGRLDIGMTMAAAVIADVKKEMEQGMPIIIDAPPGTSCPVVAALQDTDFAVLVTEPSPFGLNDLRLAVDLVRELNIPFGIVVNRAGTEKDLIDEFCERQNMEILAKIPDDRRIAENYASGTPLIEALPEYRDLFRNLLAGITGRGTV